MKYSKLQEFVDKKEWRNARYELENIQKQIVECDDVLAILASVIFLEEGNQEEAYRYISKGISYNCKNYELYFLLGNYYEHKNINQAWLCYENAEFYCDNVQDLGIIRQYKKRIERMEGWDVKKTSIVILSYNLKDICQQCIESIRKNNSPSSYEIIVVDNASSDGIVEWIKEQKDIKFICNKDNKGFPYGCNQGIKIAEPENDIFLLNNDTIVFPNAIFWLRMGLYEETNIGATGSVSNNAFDQTVEEQLDTVEKCLKYSVKNNVPMKNAYEKRIWLVGFALLLKRKALDDIGLLDVRYSPGTAEDDDICIRLHCAGWGVLLCHNSFIFHYGSGKGKNVKLWKDVKQENAEKFKQKWGFDIRYYTLGKYDLISLIDQPKDSAIRVLEIGCGMGATLARISYLWPNSDVKGIEVVESVARIGASYLEVIQGNVETMEILYEKGSFDYIIMGDVLEHLYDPEAVLKKMASYLKKDGKFLCSIPNLMHKSVVLSLLKGKFEYTEAGILDKSHIRFFTLDSIAEMFYAAGLRVQEVFVTYQSVQNMTKEDEELLRALYELPYIAEKELFEAWQYVFTAVKSSLLK